MDDKGEMLVFICYTLGCWEYLEISQERYGITAPFIDLENV